MYSIDHVVLAVSDLDEAGERLRRDHGLASVPGGVHPSWGTANRIVPLGDAYVELIAVVDLLVGHTTSLGRALLELTADGVDRWFAVCLADTQLEATAARLGLEIEPGTRTRPDGAELRWRGAGLDDDSRDAWLRSSSPGTFQRSCIRVAHRSITMSTSPASRTSRSRETGHGCATGWAETATPCRSPSSTATQASEG